MTLQSNIRVDYCIIDVHNNLIKGEKIAVNREIKEGVSNEYTALGYNTVYECTTRYCWYAVNILFWAFLIHET